MRAVILCVLAACDLRPAPKQQPTPVEPAVVAAPAAAGAPVAKPGVSEACSAVGVHFAAVVIAGNNDAAQKGVLEQERTAIVRSTSETCATQQWSAEKIDCLARADTTAALDACQAQFPPPPPGGPNRLGAAAIAPQN